MEPEDLIQLFAILPPKAQGVVLAVLAFLGSMTLVIALLKGVVLPLLKAWTLRTESKTDDEFAQKLEAVLVLATYAVDWCKRALEVIGMHKPPSVLAAKKESPP
jgi:uncharacterized membrane protein